MANKIKVTISLGISGVGANSTLSSSYTADQIGSNFTHQTQLIGTTAEALDIGTDIATGSLGYLVLRNLETPPLGATQTTGNVISVYSDAGATQKIAEVLPGHTILMPPSTLSTTVYCKASTATALLEFLAVEV